MEQIIRISALIIIPSVMGVALLAEPLLGILIGEHAFAEEKNYALICISFAVFSFGIPWGDLLAVAGKTRLLFRLNGGLAIINGLLNLILIPNLGILGAVLSTLSCHILFTIFTYFGAQSVVSFTLPKVAIFKSVGASIIACIVLFTTQNMGVEYYYSISVFLIVYSSIAFATKAFHKTDLLTLYGFIKPKNRS